MENSKCFRVSFDHIMWLFYTPLFFIAFMIIFGGNSIPLLIFPLIIACLIAIYMSLTSFIIDEIGIRKINIRHYTDYDLNWEEIKAIHIITDGRIKLITPNERPTTICVYRLKDQDLFIEYIRKYAPGKLQETTQNAPKNRQKLRFFYNYGSILFPITLLTALYMLLYKYIYINTASVIFLFALCFGILIPLIVRFELQQESQSKQVPEPRYKEWIKAINVLILLSVWVYFPFANANNYFDKLNNKWPFILFFINAIIMGWSFACIIMRRKILSLIDKITTPRD